MSDVAVTYSVLNELNGSLKQIIVELEKAEGRTNAVEDAIGTPHGKSRLRDKVADFEAGWDIRRGRLKDDLVKIQERVEETGRTWAEWDVEASKSTQVERNEASTLPSAV